MQSNTERVRDRKSLRLFELQNVAHALRYTHPNPDTEYLFAITLPCQKPKTILSRYYYILQLEFEENMHRSSTNCDGGVSD